MADVSDVMYIHCLIICYLYIYIHIYTVHTYCVHRRKLCAVCVCGVLLVCHYVFIRIRDRATACAGQ